MSLRILSALVLLILFSAPSGVSSEEKNWRQRPSQGEVVTTSDIEAEIEFGREVAARILGRYRIYDSASLVRYVNLVGLSLVRSTNRPELEYHFMILDSTDINAYAAPGGYVFVTRGALQLMKDEAELAGVLAHEIVHITEKHVVRELNIKGSDSSAASGLARLVGGSSESARVAFSQAVDKALSTLFEKGYKREDETQADKTAALITALSGYDSDGLARYLERISAVKGKTVEIIDRTHPPFAQRAAVIREVINNEGIKTGALKTNKERFTRVIKDLK